MSKGSSLGAVECVRIALLAVGDRVDIRCDVCYDLQGGGADKDNRYAGTVRGGMGVEPRRSTGSTGIWNGSVDEPTGRHGNGLR